MRSLASLGMTTVGPDKGPPEGRCLISYCAGGFGMIQDKPKRNRTGFTLVELIVIVVVIVLLAVLIWPNMTAVREKAQRVNCLANLNQMWKASAWGLAPEDALRPGGAETNGLGAFKELAPEAFICPEAGLLCKTKPDTNCYYQSYSGLRDSDGDKVVMCDMNGPNRIAGPNAWGGNHSGRGGNVVWFSGAAQWVDSTNYPGIFCITNQAIFNGFSINNGIKVWPLNKPFRNTE